MGTIQDLDAKDQSETGRVAQDEETLAADEQTLSTDHAAYVQAVRDVGKPVVIINGDSVSILQLDGTGALTRTEAVLGTTAAVALPNTGSAPLPAPPPA